MSECKVCKGLKRFGLAAARGTAETGIQPWHPGCSAGSYRITEVHDDGAKPDRRTGPRRGDAHARGGADDDHTTTPPGACVVEASFASLECRTDALVLRLQGAPDLGRTKDTLVRQAAKLDERLRDAEAQMVAGDARKARTRLKKAGRVLIAIGFRLRSLTGRRQIAAATRAELQTTIAGLDTDLRTLRGTF
jgi:hypothetical protein